MAFLNKPMTMPRAFGVIAFTTLLGAVIGGALGWGIGTFTPEYYRSVFRTDSPGFNPVEVGIALGVTEGLLIGLAQVVFYLLLLAMSEHLGVWAAYGVAALATITLTAGYALTIFRSQPRAMVTFAGLTLTYLVQFVLVLVEDYALLIGSGLVFAALAATMFMTRKVDWYGMTAGVEGRASPAN